jgi:hypothetical protein
MSLSQFQGLVMVAFGTVCTVFSERFGVQASAFQRRVFKVDLSPRSLALANLFGGLAFCVVGVLALIGVVAFRE